MLSDLVCGRGVWGGEDVVRASRGVWGGEDVVRASLWGVCGVGKMLSDLVCGRGCVGWGRCCQI